MSCLLNDIEEAMYTLISGMKRGTYNFTWGTVNNPDMAKQKFPSAQVILESEENIDDPDGPDSNLYFQQAFYQIVVYCRLSSETEIPVYEINKELNQALEDLKKLFGVNYHLNTSYVDDMMYLGMTREYTPNQDVMIPTRMITRWRLRYEQSRTDPSLVG